MDLRDKIEELEAKEQAMILNERKLQAASREALLKAEKGEPTKKPEIVIPKVGKPRAKKATD